MLKPVPLIKNSALPRYLLYVRTIGFAICALVFAACPGLAHEFWIEPAEYQVESGASLIADLRNGQDFSGTDLAFFENRTARFELVAGKRTMAVTSRMGDVPALRTTAPNDGLAVIVHQTAASTITYKEWKKFLTFAEHKDFPDIAARHATRELPVDEFTETYTRYAKALVGIGTAVGADAPTGMETEFVARTNPYTEDPDNGFSVLLLYKGVARTDAQIEVFDRAPGGSVTVTLTRSNAKGRATIPVQRGHTYLLDAVVLRPAPDGGKPVWETLWAAMTFAVPASSR